jgi:outer membrane receptor protein involved in Fe transport
LPQSVVLVVLSVLLAAGEGIAGTTGKIAGRARDAETREPLVGISVVVEGSTMGASTDVDGNFTIVSVPPGTYAVVASGVGFQKKRFVNVKVSVDFTTRLDVELGTDVIALETVEVQAEAPMIRRDLTSSQTVVDAASIEALPVESVTQILSLQAGIIQGTGGELHIRGGRSTEIQYTVNGVSITNPFDNSRAVEIATNAIQELSVVSGTFNAEYGNALSGIVNTVTKEGGSSYRGSLSFYTGDKVSTRNDVFLDIDRVQPFNSTVTEGTLSGPIPGFGNEFTFFLSGRYEDDRGWLFGIRQHNPTDYITKNPADPNDITVVKTGDSALVAMNPSREFSGTAKIAFAPVPALKFKYDVVYSKSFYKSYNHDLKYNPEANYNNHEWGLLNSLEIRYSPNSTTYLTLRGAYNLNDFQQYLYPLLDAYGNETSFYAGKGLDTSQIRADSRYQPDYKLIRAATYTFLSGGTLNDQYYQRSRTMGLKFDITSQVTSNHEVKLGAEYKDHKLDYEYFSILRDTVRYFVPTIPGTNTADHDSYSKFPREFSAYLQDKMEFENLILNVGLRYDYFAPKAVHAPNIFLPTPNSPTLLPGVDRSKILVNAEPKHQWSPRLGVSFPITDRGIIHFSYGHFFQMPPFLFLYANPEFKYSYATGTPTYGNANLYPEKTVTYELGLQQQLSDNIAMNVTGFSKDVRDLLATQQIRISGDESYYKYVNKDYANIKGITLSFTKRRTAGDLLGVTVDYTFQVAEGNETASDAFFLDLSSGRQSEKIPVLLDWDQTHTLNMTVAVGRANDWNVTLVGRLGSGLPYTPQVTSETIFLQTNSGRKPTQITVDLLADKTFTYKSFQFTVFAKVFNLFDSLSERIVYSSTGRAGYALEQIQGPALETDKISARIPGVHSADEYFVRPQYYLPPREVRLGVSLEF